MKVLSGRSRLFFHQESYSARGGPRPSVVGVFRYPRLSTPFSARSRRRYPTASLRRIRAIWVGTRFSAHTLKPAGAMFARTSSAGGGGGVPLEKGAQGPFWWSRGVLKKT